MESNKIRNIIRDFYHRDSSKRTQFLFRRWFLLDEHQTEKDEYMQELLDNSPSVISAQTLEDFSKVRLMISQEKQSAKSIFPFINRYAGYAASIVLIIAVSVYVTYLFVAPSQLEYTELSVSYGESKKITISDGTVVTINAGSTLIYPVTFKANTRTVYLSGEANFSVANNPDKPFIVKTKHLNVRAIGTKFNVQSYPNTEYTKATLVEGSVSINMQHGDGENYILKPNNQLSYSSRDNKISIMNVNATQIASWEDGYLIFQGVPFDEIAKTLERKYNIVINYSGRKLNQQSYYVKFRPDESIKDVMEVLTALINTSSYKIEGSTVYFYSSVYN